MKWLKFFSPVKSITSLRAKEMMGAEAGWILLDVREPSEYAQGHIKGSVHIPLLQTGKRSGELGKGKTVLVYCRCGNRSKLASRILAAKGFIDVYNVEGGIVGWEGEGEGEAKG
ncbi:rhodanese-like domain-containing protein [Desulfoluna sp.]|uniref:rhodanese-like domain-containing protein n=1 Tax=Desulfoluna sp. TaxID=2045199 RepID=UPI00262D132F|nr:rhodanese-like domain-containing protein [Desulfoluna sp.]